MWNAAWRMIQDKPWLGHGLNTFMANYMKYAVGATQGPAYAHNCFLQITAETGILGIVLFLAFVGGWLKIVLRALKHGMESSPLPLKPLLAGITAALVAFLVQSAFDTNFYSLRQAVLFWSLNGLSIGIAAHILRSS